MIAPEPRDHGGHSGPGQPADGGHVRADQVGHHLRVDAGELAVSGESDIADQQVGPGRCDHPFQPGQVARIGQVYG